MIEYLKRKTGWIVIIILVFIIPTILWVMATPNILVDSFTNFWSATLVLGRLFGIFGVCLYAITLILSTRWRFIEPMFGGLNRVYIAHHIAGGIALLLLLFHPIMMAISRISGSWFEAAKLLLPGSNLAYNLGMLALFGMVGLLILTYYPKLPYAVWKFTHKFLGLFFAIGALHILLVQGTDIEASFVLKLYVYTLIALGLFAYTYRTLLPSIFVRTYQYTVEKVNLPKPDIVEVIMTAKNQLMNFRAGQFIFVRFPGQHVVPDEAHPFSINNAPSDGKISVSAKMLGDFTTTMAKLQPGAEVIIEGAFGRFSYTNFKNHNQIWIAGGIGITPFVSMAKMLPATPDFKVDLYYSCKTKDEFLYLDILFYDLVKRHPNFRLITWAGDKMGNITAEKIKELSEGVEGKEIFICGPPPMMKALRSQFKEQKVPDSAIHSEEFAIQ